MFQAGKKILIAAHGNSLRGIVKHLDSMSDEAIMGCNLPTGIPFVYELDADLKVKIFSTYANLCANKLCLKNDFHVSKNNKFLKAKI